MALDIDRANISQANSTSFLKDLGLNTNDFNLGNSLAKAGFLIAELPSQLISKKIGPDRWIPAQMCLWSIVAGSQFFLSGRSSFLATRFLVGLCQGGFIPDVILYLSYYYKKSELSMRLAFFFTCNYSVYIFAGFLAIGILKMDRIGGHEGWRWLFLIEALFTFVVGFITFFMLPASPTQTKTWFRPNGWFTEREEIIMTNRILRDDPQKGQMHNRQAISWTMLWESLTDFDLWPLYAIGLVFQIPQTPIQAYLTLAYRQLGFDTVMTNLLSIPNYALGIVTLLLLISFSEALNERSFVAMSQNLWVLPCLIALYCLPAHAPWSYFAVSTVLLGAPYAHALLVSWVSMNAGSVRSRTVGSSLYNMCVQLSGIIAAYIYRADDAPLYRRGNRQLIAICCMCIVMFPMVKSYYIYRNKQKRKVWDAMTREQQSEYLDTTRESGSKRLDFQFFH
ncbi:MFS general substrate transporter [Clavulina sp. PMI_390]|nr:MFS general substrate transporter [Clavulina sp. PMI_390]